MKTIIKEYISIKKAAEILDISIPGIFAAHKRGTLPMYQIQDNINVIKLTDIMEYKKLRYKRGHKVKKLS